MPFRKRSHVLLMLLSALLPLAGCSGNDQPASSALSAPTAPTAVTGATGVSTTAGAEKKCISVQFLASFERFVIPASAVFVLSGDLVGHLTVTFDDTSYDYSGPRHFYRGTESIDGTGEWVISGGSVPGPLTFQTAFTNRNLISAIAGSPAEVFENIGSHRATGGVSKANLSYKGTAWGDPAADYHAEHRYQGVICP